jgi:hypothetical protein
MVTAVPNSISIGKKNHYQWKFWDAYHTNLLEKSYVIQENINKTLCSEIRFN